MNRNRYIYILSVVFLVFLCGFSSHSIKGKQEPKKATQDTLKKLPQTLEEEVQDSATIYKGQFKIYKEKAHASYYANKFNGRRTASGKRFDNNKLTAAHKKLPFGTKLRVTNLENKKSVIVEVVDRGPFVKGREIDLSRKAFMTITSNKNSGQVMVSLEILEP